MLVILAGASWGIISIFVRRLSNAGISALNITSLRSVFAALALLLVMPFVAPSAFRIKLRDIWCFAGCGVASISMFNLLYFSTMQRTSVAIAVVLLYTSPIFVTAMSCLFFKERFGRGKVIALALVTAGCVLVSGALNGNAENRLDWRVLLCGIGSGFCYALYSIFGRFAQRRGYGSDAITLWAFIFAGVFSLFVVDWGQMPQIAKSPALWPFIAGLVALSTILPYFAYTAGLKRLQPSTAAIAATVEPVIGTLVGIIIFGESLTWVAMSGMLLILCAIFL